ncbi:MAG TPA: hypothetical protein VK530_08530 [Candidatus Acidoferrum sp.]|nr:hypothetical protein [Candidatus Acidoferrum sp.]
MAGDDTATNTPPYSQIFVRGGPGDFVGLTNVIFIHRAFDTVEVLFDVGDDNDADGDLMEFHWSDNAPGNVTSFAVRFTNDYAPGKYRVSANITDHKDTVFPTVDFEVISALQGMRMLLADVELTERHQQIKHLRAPLRLAEKAMERRNWNIATRRLERFKKGLTRHLSTQIEEEVQIIERWSDAAGTVQWAIQKLPRHPGPGAPPGVFPGSSSSSGGLVIVYQLPYPASTNTIPTPYPGGSYLVALIEARRLELLSNNMPIIVATNILPPTGFNPTVITNSPPVVITPPASGDSGATVIRAWTDANYLNGEGQIFPPLINPGVISNPFNATP